MRSIRELDAAHGIIGTPIPRIDSGAKVRGRTRFGADLAVVGMLHARLVLSPYAHARIRSIDSSMARAARGVEAVLTARDLPIVSSGDTRADEPLARDEARFAGQPVAIVLARTEEEAEDAVALVSVDWEPLPIVMNMAAALVGGSPLAHVTGTASAEGSTGGHAVVHTDDSLDAGSEASGNAVGTTTFTRGDVTAALDGCEAVVSGRFSTAWVHQGYLEPQVGMAQLDDDDTLVVTSSVQGTFAVRTGLARILGLPESAVRVIAAPLGGGFGAKTLIIEPLVAAACLATRRPVRLVLTRMEDMALTNPAPASIIELRIGGDHEHGLVAIEARITLDAGSFSEWSMHGLAALVIGGPYRWTAARVDAQGVRTNRVGTGPYRAPTGPQTAFALESLVDELAGALAMDPLELRALSAIKADDLRLDDVAWPPTGIAECLATLRDHPLWVQRASLPPGEGVGMAACVWPGMNEPATATCKLDPDGRLTVMTGVADMTGTATGLAMIASAELGVPIEHIRIAIADTATAPQTPMSGGSVITYSVGLAVQAAARDARRQLLDVAADLLEANPADLDLVGGRVEAVGSPDRGMTLVELAARLTEVGSPYPPVQGQGRTVPEAIAPSATAHLAHVRVDADTGVVTPIAHVVVQDVGRAINPALVEGQMRGGVAQGYGWALSEALRHDDDGQLLTGSFLDYALPRATDLPAIETIIVEVPSRDGPFGARGIGEAPVVAVAGAVANAVRAATGRGMRVLPMTAPAIWRALREPIP